MCFTAQIVVLLLAGQEIGKRVAVVEGRLDACLQLDLDVDFGQASAIWSGSQPVSMASIPALSSCRLLVLQLTPAWDAIAWR